MSPSLGQVPKLSPPEVCVEHGRERNQQHKAEKRPMARMLILVVPEGREQGHQHVWEGTVDPTDVTPCSVGQKHIKVAFC